jgi:hypothetical protein
MRPGRKNGQLTGTARDLASAVAVQDWLVSPSASDGAASSDLGDGPMGRNLRPERAHRATVVGDTATNLLAATSPSEPVLPCGPSCTPMILALSFT